ncbi:MAG: DUF4178 domain-containing protein, partial [Candidatus Eremiobacteraeota bacterium]|nr:DUF4178 domain-containing protein [Candidatus Eremiobacteraeota bacterium]
TNLMTSKVVSYEGDLPFIMPGEYALPSADLRSCSGKAATIDYSEEKPILFLGEYVPFEQLEFRGLREASTEADDMAGPTLHFGAVKKFNCTSCGAPLEIKGGPRSQVIVCEYCDAAIDARDPNMAILWKAEQQRAHKVPPSIPLGSKAMLEEAEWECIGFMRRSVTYEGVSYPWSEYLLHNRYKGYRWLTESDGHFTLMDALKKLPEQGNAPVSFPTQSDIRWDGRAFRHFQSSQARVDYVAGEFYWRVTLGDPAVNHDYIDPPDILSMEVSEKGIDWSHGVYVTGQDVWEGFGLEGRPPRTSGVAPNQVNPLTEKRTAVWRLFKLLVVLALLLTGFQWFTSKSQKPIYLKSFDQMSYEKEPSKVSEPFEIKGSTANLAIDISAANLSNRWAYFNMSLVNQKTKKRYVFGKNLSYYYGRGDRQGRILLSSIPAGTYVLNWDIQTAGPGGKKDDNKPPAAGAKPSRQFSYTIKVIRGVPQWGWVFLLIFLLIWSPIITTARYNSFETRRWSQSDHA